MNLYKAIYQTPDGNLFTRIIWANNDESALAQANLGKKRNVIISLQKVHDFLQGERVYKNVMP